MLRPLWRVGWFLLCSIGRTFGDVRPRRILDLVGRRAWPDPIHTWRKNRWGDELHLSPSFHIDRNIIALGTYDRDLHLAFEHCVEPGMTCLDVGANLGEMTLHLARLVGAGGRVHAFEPAPRIRDRLTAHVARNHYEDRVTVHPLALADHEGSLPLTCPSPTEDNQGTASLVDLVSSTPTAETTRVPIMTLDELAERHPIPRIDLVKVDIQGAEPLFLRGADTVLRRDHPILFIEVSKTDLAHGKATPRALIRQLTEIGYTVRTLRRGGTAGVRIDPVTVDESFDVPNVVCRAE
ncbi:MAG: hypothetical protein CMJ83_19700 [Planctomycetes bacterium]|jgi:FkbM family methyltransferase|nr:hypothetical protein [Planctomycetota bacterium]